MRLADRPARCLTLLVICGALNLEALSARPLFPNPVFPVGKNPSSMIIADFNRDGRADMAVANFGNGHPGETSISLLLGRGDGTFADQIVLATVDQPTCLATADLNADGKLDLIIGHPGYLGVAFGNGDGTFAAETPTFAAMAPYQAFVVDYNRDGMPDLIVAGIDFTGQGVAEFFLGSGDGSLLAQPSQSFDHRGPLASMGDLNEDGYPDLAVGNLDGTYSFILLGNADGTFQAPRSLLTGPVWATVTLGDFNSDGHLDLVVSQIIGALSPS